MTYSKSVTFILVAFVAITAASAEAGQRASGRPSGGGSAVGRAAPRPSGGGRVVPYRSYYYRPYRPGLTLGFYGGFGYPFGYPYGYRYGYPFGYGYYGYPYGYPYGAYGAAYGGVRIQGAPKDAQVFADGYYVGIVDDFDGAFQHMNLQAGPHRIEVRLEGYRPIAFEVNVQPGQTINYRAGNLP
jgi:PEGA domain